MIIIITTQYGQGPTDELSLRIIIRGSFADGLDNIHSLHGGIRTSQNIQYCER
jgi:hypothetical protein